ncbi:MAG: hypothetical protein ACKPKO_03600, partial [Candidatus Fonsibacter sp.]
MEIKTVVFWYATLRMFHVCSDSECPNLNDGKMITLTPTGCQMQCMYMPVARHSIEGRRWKSRLWSFGKQNSGCPFFSECLENDH